MSIAIENLQGKTKGSCYNLTFYELNGQQVVRQKAISIKNPRTPAQQLNRLNVKNCLDSYRPLKPLLFKSLNNRSKNQMTVHKFFALNLNKAFKEGLFFPENLKLSGSLFPADEFSFNFFPSLSPHMFFSWTPMENENKRNSDILCIAHFSHSRNKFFYNLSNITRNQELFSYSFNPGQSGDKFTFYLFFVRSDFSDSGQAAIINFTTP